MKVICSLLFFQPERELADPKMVPYNGGLTISSETTQPGQWTCHARNDVGVIQYTFNVHINGI